MTRDGQGESRPCGGGSGVESGPGLKGESEFTGGQRKGQEQGLLSCGPGHFKGGEAWPCVQCRKDRAVPTTVMRCVS